VTTVLVTGAAGFIGSHFVDYLLRTTDWGIACLDRLDSAANLARLTSMSSWKANADRVAVRFHDLRGVVNHEVAGQLVGPFGFRPFDYVVHLAAGSHVDRSVSDPGLFVLDNCVGTLNLLDFCRKPGVLSKDGRILVFSTDEVFGPAPAGVSFKPWDRHNPGNPYAASKSGSENIAIGHAATFGMPIVVTHCSNVTGSGQASEKFLPLAMMKTALGDSVPIHTVDGKPCSRYYVDVENVCSATHAVLTRGSLLDGSDVAGKYNISGDVELNNVELVERIAAVMGKPARYHLVENPPGRLRPDLRYAIDDTETRALGWAPPVTFDAGLKRTVEAFLATWTDPRAEAAQ
jgi:dTDP-glucose 4,6-dehydratase